jgi:hypothetical protein
MSAGSTDPDAAAMSAIQRIALGFLGQKGGDLSYGAAKSGFRELVRRDPVDSILVGVLGGAYLFYLAEKGKNPKCESFWDALVFIATSLSVGYDDVFAKTEAGKAIAAFVMTFGPALAAAALAPSAADREAEGAKAAAQAAEAMEVQRAILARLDAILLSLRSAEATSAGAAAPPT